MKMNQSQRLFLAGALWIAIGTFLAVRGAAYFKAAHVMSPLWAYLGLALGVVVGCAKGLFVLRKSAKRVIARIESRVAPEPFWQIYPPYLYLLIPLMIGLGLTLRHFFGASHPSLILGVYAGIGAALLVSAMPFFAARARLNAKA